MKVLVAIDSFKGSLSSIEVSNAVEIGIKKVYENAEIIKVPIADGGEGTVDTLLAGLGGKIIEVEVNDPLMRRIKASYGILPDNTAVIEMASCSGLPLLKEEERNPLKTTTFGVGEIIKDAIGKGCRHFIIGIGGSATNDGGLGMLEALGYRFYDDNNNELKGIGESLNYVNSMDYSNVIKELADCHFEVLCDVTNPFYGENGASYVYAAQKGADTNTIKILDAGLRHFAQFIHTNLNIDIDNIKGAGASGGLGGGIYAFLKGRLAPGIEVIFKKINIEERIKDCNVIITGEGKMDGQSVMGKVPEGICKLGQKFKIPVIGLCGGLMPEAYKMHDIGMVSIFSIMNYPMSLSEAMDKEKAKKLVEYNTTEIFRLIKQFR